MPASSLNGSPKPRTDAAPQSWQNERPADPDELRRASAFIVADDLSRDDWVKVGAAHHYYGLWPEFLALSQRYTRHGAEKNLGDARKLWESFKRGSGRLARDGTIFEYARRNEAYGGQSEDGGRIAGAPRGRGKKTGEFESWDGIEPENFDWLWRYWLAKGELHLIAGAIGAGKTTIALSLAACLTSGGEWPDGSKAAKGRVLFWSGEDLVSKTLIPRFMAMGGDRSRIGGISVVEGGKKRSFDPAADLDILRDELEEARRRGRADLAHRHRPVHRHRQDRHPQERRDPARHAAARGLGAGVRRRGARRDALHEGDAEAGRQRAGHWVTRFRGAGEGDIRRRRSARRGGAGRVQGLKQDQGLVHPDEVELRPQRERLRL